MEQKIEDNLDVEDINISIRKFSLTTEEIENKLHDNQKFKRFEDCVVEGIEEINEDIILVWENVRDENNIPVTGICRIKNQEKIYFFCTQGDKNDIYIFEMDEHTLNYMIFYIEDYTKYMGNINHYGSLFSIEGGESDIIFTEKIDMYNLMINPLFYTSFDNILNKNQNIIIEEN